MLAAARRALATLQKDFRRTLCPGCQSVSCGACRVGFEIVHLNATTRDFRSMPDRAEPVGADGRPPQKPGRAVGPKRRRFKNVPK